MRPDDKSYAKGNLDGFDRYLERKAPPSPDHAYVTGYHAGQLDRAALASGTGRPRAASHDADYKLGYEDARNQRACRHKDRSNSAYARGYRDGQKEREQSWLDKGWNNPTDR